ncbi:ABC transporter ATP-binding protein [Desulfosporosinus hippei]|uniref:Teichoic acid transport system ATP-binding protein n=1 Tax=Desulfosporosinus hippei DSM 8344 TaxID=1121419 RepID=A0A1G7U2H1_9FIRM|nr:ABC transporter ATP-binding protein [Desulfosporosinus hippei]SDG41792.1 teichoic acid transport system ATP-binding protein [Desulfosporosinus hippei DSM 8344]
MDEIVINADKLTKVYRLYNKPIDRLKEAVSFGSRKKHHKDFCALEEISFEIRRGETVGIIGKNGSGKSTLLKILTGVLTPTAGNLSVVGRVSALLELGTGFNPEYTGIENIYLSGTIMGYSKEEMNAKLENIISFADIGDFIYQPVKTYSSGMFVRLAFAVAINVDPEVLIIDEALSVGDIKFQQKCYRKIEEFKRDKTVLFVSHDLIAVNKFCDRTIWLNEGVVVEDGKPFEVSKRYQAFMLDSKLTKYDESDKGEVLVSNDNINLNDISLDVLGDNKAQIIGIGLYDVLNNKKVAIVTIGQAVRLYIRVKFNSAIENPIYGFSIKDQLNNIVTQTNSYVLNKSVIYGNVGEIVNVAFEFAVPNLNIGSYTISPALASGSQEDHIQHSWVHDALVFQVVSQKKYHLPGFIALDEVEFSILQ